MDNQHGNQTAAWIAGLWLADGTFGLNVNKRKGQKNYRYAPQIVLAMKDHDIIEKVYHLLRENGVGAWMGRRSSGPNNADLWQVGVRSWGKARKMIDFLRPFLMGRKLVSASILYMLVNETQGGAGHFSDEELALRAWAHEAIKIANSGTEPSQTIISAPPPQVDDGIVEALREILGNI